MSHDPIFKSRGAQDIHGAQYHRTLVHDWEQEDKASTTSSQSGTGKGWTVFEGPPVFYIDPRVLDCLYKRKPILITVDSDVQ